ncbi:MAG: NUDIX domain-containing protein [Oscillatoriales cyanobacterium RM1_1_9]|nr:NUDIX domain-containing protein [Oscillatoriales cyanobacterium RM1_1_9]
MVIDQSWYQVSAVLNPDLPTEISAGGIVVRGEAGRIYLALIEEGPDRPGFVLPKGHVDPGETIEQAARREIAEEAGLSELQLIADLGVRERLNLSKTAWKKIYYFLFTTEQVEGVPTDLYKSYQLHWFALEKLPRLFWPEQRNWWNLTGL